MVQSKVGGTWIYTSHNWEIIKFDIINVFLNGDLNETLISIPPRFQEKDKIGRLYKTKENTIWSRTITKNMVQKIYKN